MPTDSLTFLAVFSATEHEATFYDALPTVPEATFGILNADFRPVTRIDPTGAATPRGDAVDSFEVPATARRPIALQMGVVRTVRIPYAHSFSPK